MDWTTATLGGVELPVLTLDTIVIGSGCAGFNAADWLYDLGRRDFALVTEGLYMGTSRNTGSDKQTYYKLSLASDGSDSVREMAETLFSGGGVNGDTALIEAAGSVKSFIKLANLGVPFPTNRYGEYVGYKTDHDPRQRATSAGPLTSKYMTECLERSVLRKGIKILDGMQVVQLLVGEGKIRGALAVNTLHMSGKNLGFTLFCCSNVILATGGPAGVYLTSVYPESQTGMTGMALEAGAQGANLQEWQYGLASIQFRWNVSGTYQQVLPCYIAVDREGNEREFLPEYFDTPQQALDMVFLKGYQWPFDVSKAGASSMVDLIVYHEIFDKGNRVFMDFRTEPSGLEKGFEALGEETRRYLSRSGALLPLPIKRLEKMNPKAIELYRSHGIDLYREPLEIAVCAQHNNGGLAVDENWQTCVEGLYAAGEVAGTFGVYRPGGSALNSTQVGSMRAAEHIACSKEERAPEQAAFLAAAAAAEPLLRQVMAVYERRGERSGIMEQRLEAQKAMSSFGAFIRNPEEMRTLSETLERTLNRFFEDAQIASAQDLPHLLKNRDLLVTQLALLNAMQEAAFAVGSRGSAFVTSPDGAEVGGKLSMFRYLEGTGAHREDILLTEKTETGFCSRFVPVRPFPPSDDWFETVWNEFNERTRRVYR